MWTVKQEEVEKLVAAVDYSEALTITAGEKEVSDACEAAKKFGFRAVVAFPQHLGLIVDSLKGSKVLAQIPVGFPCGGATTRIKCAEAEEGLKRGASDLDMVMNISAFKAGNYKKVTQDIQEILAIAKPFKVPFKVIIEIGVLSDEEILTAAKLVMDSGAAFVKTCTGFGPGRATCRAIEMIKEVVGDKIGIKASGGVASVEDGIALMRSGAAVIALRKHLVDQLAKQGYHSRKV